MTISSELKMNASMVIGGVLCVAILTGMGQLVNDPPLAPMSTGEFSNPPLAPWEITGYVSPKVIPQAACDKGKQFLTLWNNGELFSKQERKLTIVQDKLSMFESQAKFAREFVSNNC